MNSTIKKWNILILAILVITLVWPVSAQAKGLFDDKVIFGGTFTLYTDETLNGNLVVFGGTITLEADSTVNGDVVLIGGTVTANGVVNGNLVGVGGSVSLEETAQIFGDLVTVGATLNQREGAQITGQVLQEMPAPFQFSVPTETKFTDDIFRRRTSIVANPLLEGVWFFFRIFIWAAVAVLLVLFFSKETDRVARAAFAQPVITGGAGVLSFFVVLILVMTIIGIPVAFVALILMGVAWLIGWVALGLEVGRRIAKMLNQIWAPAVAAGVGTLILYFVLGGFSLLIPCVGWIPKTMVGIWGLGAALVTYFGTREYPEDIRVVDVSVLEDGEAADNPVVGELDSSLPDDGLAPEGDDK